MNRSVARPPGPQEFLWFQRPAAMLSPQARFSLETAESSRFLSFAPCRLLNFRKFIPAARWIP